MNAIPEREIRWPDPNDPIKCIDCGGEFYFPEDEQGFFKEKGLMPPRRCRDCRQKRKNDGCTQRAEHHIPDPPSRDPDPVGDTDGETPFEIVSATKELLEDIIENFLRVSDFDIEKTQGVQTVVFMIKVRKDVATLIGKDGQMIDALKTVVRAAGKKYGYTFELEVDAPRVGG